MPKGRNSSIWPRSYTCMEFHCTQRCSTRQYLSKSYFYLQISPIGRLKLNKCRKVLSPRFDLEFTVRWKYALWSLVVQVKTFPNHILICNYLLKEGYNKINAEKSKVHNLTYSLQSDGNLLCVALWYKSIPFQITFLFAIISKMKAKIK